MECCLSYTARELGEVAWLRLCVDVQYVHTYTFSAHENCNLIRDDENVQCIAISCTQINVWDKSCIVYDVVYGIYTWCSMFTKNG